jgi:putative copper export protein
MSFITILIDWIHLTGMAMWVGGLWYTYYIFYPMTEQLDGPGRMKAITVHSQRFPQYANPVIGILILTGLFNTFNGKFLFTSLGDFSTTYNIILGLKMVVVIVMVTLGTTIGTRLAPKAMSMAPKPGEKPSPEFLETVALIKKLSTITLVLGFVLLFFAATLLNGAVF